MPSRRNSEVDSFDQSSVRQDCRNSMASALHPGNGAGNDPRRPVVISVEFALYLLPVLVVSNVNLG